MKRAIALSVVVAGLWTSPSYAQNSQRLLSSLSVGLGNLDCTIAGPTVAQLPWDDLLRSLEQGIEAIRSRHDAGDGAPPVLRVDGGRPRIQPGGRLTLQRGARLIDAIWSGIGPADTTDALLSDAGRFLDVGVIDDDDDESIAVLERAVLTQAFAYAVNARIRSLCDDPAAGTAAGTFARGSRAPEDETTLPATASPRTEPASGGGVPTLGGSRRPGAQLGLARRLAQAVEPDRQQVRSGPSVAKLAVVLGMVAGGVAITLVEPTQPTQPGQVDLREYLGDGAYPGHSYRLVRRRGMQYGARWYVTCGGSRTSGRCLWHVSRLNQLLADNYRRGYTDGYDDGLFRGLARGHREGWHQGYNRGQRSVIEIIDRNGVVVYEGPFKPYEERAPALKYGGAALAIGGALVAVLWNDGPRLSASPTNGGARGSVSFGF